MSASRAAKRDTGLKTRKLREQVISMTARINALEAALAESLAESGELPTSAIAPGTADSDLDEFVKGIGSLSISSDGRAKYRGESAHSEYLQELLPNREETEKERFDKKLNLPPEVLDLVAAFPLGLPGRPYSKQIFLPFLPPEDLALKFVENHYSDTWLFDTVQRHDFMETVFTPVYGDSRFINLDSVHCHRLSLLFSVLASGAYVESSTSPLIEPYHTLARASFSLVQASKGNCATVQALFLIIQFTYKIDRSANEERWLLIGLCCRIAQSVGLQRDSPTWNLPPAEVQRRRVMFWDLYMFEGWTSLLHGRPTALKPRHTDCQFPDDLDSVVMPSGQSDIGWHAWRIRFAATCITASVQQIFATKVPSYQHRLDLDERIRNFPVPSYLEFPMKWSDENLWSPNPCRALQQYSVVFHKETNLLFLHRSYFVQAIRENPQNPLDHKYARSVMAVYQSAIHLIYGLKGLYGMHPEPATHVWFFWSSIFSSYIVLGALVIDSPGCSLAANALHELDNALPFYAEGSRVCGQPGTVEALHKLRERAHDKLIALRAGNVPPAYPSDKSRGPDELELLEGRQTLIKAPSSHPTTPSSPPSHPAAAATTFVPPAVNNQAGWTTFDLTSSLPQFGFPTQTEGNWEVTNAQGTITHYFGQSQGPQVGVHIPPSPPQVAPYGQAYTPFEQQFIGDLRTTPNQTWDNGSSSTNPTGEQYWINYKETNANAERYY